MEGVEKIKRRVQYKSRPKLNRRDNQPRIKGVLEFITHHKEFTPRIRRIVPGLRRQHHILNRTVVQTIKQHCLGKIRALVQYFRNLLWSVWITTRHLIQHRMSYYYTYSNALPFVRRIEQLMSLGEPALHHYIRCSTGLNRAGHT